MRYKLGIVAVIACLGALLFVAPRFLRVRMRPVAPAVKINLAAIRTAEESYFREYGRYVAASPVPAFVPGPEPIPWPLSRDETHGFNTLGWRPARKVTCQYAVTVEGESFTAEARCRAASAKAPIAWGFVKPAAGELQGVPGPFGRCRPTGVFNPDNPSAPRLRVSGPCDRESVEAAR